MKKYKMIESKDGKCPYCESDYVMKTVAAGNKAEPPDPPKEGCVFYKCYRCNKDFYCIVE